jgi:ribosome recycling factor
MVSQNLQSAEEKMQGTARVLKADLAGIRTGRASPALIEHIKADYAGVATPINQMASISIPEARLLVVRPWDKNNIKDIEKAIL